MSYVSRIAVLAVCAAAAPAFAQITVSNAWVRSTVPQQKTSAAYMKIDSKQPVSLVAASSPVAGVAEIHEMAMDKGVMKMRAADKLDVAAGKPAELKPGGYHVMLLELKQPLKAGDSVALTLTFEKADKTRETVDVKAQVRALGATSAPAAGADHAMKH